MKKQLKKKQLTLFVSAMTLFVLIGCSKEEYQGQEFDVSRQIGEHEISQKSADLVPMDEALALLDGFLSATYVNNKTTRSEQPRKIESVDTYYYTPYSTRSGESLPNAYIVNFENNEGYAVLGANTAVASIVAVTEKGHINPVTLEVREARDTCSPYTRTTSSSDGENGSESLADEGTIVTEGIKSAIIKLPDDDGPGGDGGGSGSGSGNQYAVHSPMLTTEWNQGGWGLANVYNKYCYTYKNDTLQYAHAGCSTTALAQIIAFNEFPTTLIVNGTTLNYTAMKTSANASSLYPIANRENVSLLYGGIFDNVDKLFILQSGTCITPAEIRDLMPYMGYTNVTMLSNSDFNASMLSATSAMLQAGKPVFISAIEGVLGGHSWVIDGSMYYYGIYKLHCNWGWSGTDNGYFDPSCFDPSTAGGSYSWHYRLITYDIPSDSITCAMSCLP